MDNLFDSPDMAAGYARARPALHPRIIGLAGKYLQPLPVENALDVGCGAGLSTRALESIARHCHGIDPLRIDDPVRNRPLAWLHFQSGHG